MVICQTGCEHLPSSVPDVNIPVPAYEIILDNGDTNPCGEHLQQCGSLLSDFFGKNLVPGCFRRGPNKLLMLGCFLVDDERPKPRHPALLYS